MSKQSSITPQEQQKLLDNSISIIKSEIYQMRKCLDNKHKLMDALKHASNFLNELRTSSLNPKQYYELYILIYDGLNYLTLYLKDNGNNNNNNKSNTNYLIDLYELIQYAGNIIPRLYLMITIGSIYLNNKDAPINEVMNDMLEMCKGVQNPIRGLFLRYYLIQRTKNYLINSASSNDDKTTDNIINFIINNFIEMNKLWVRLQFQGHSSEREKRIIERNELKILVGSNLVILSQLDSINLKKYNELILPEILKQIINCNDSIAQNYLLDVIIQIFPDNFQISSLKIFLNSLLMVNMNVNITLLINSLIDRLIHYKLRNNDILNDNSFLNEFIKFIKKLNEMNVEFSINDYCLILNEILKLSLIFNNDDNYEIINLIYQLSIEKYELSKDKKDSDKFKIILKSIKNFKNFQDFLKINDENYFKLFNLQSMKVKNEISNIIINKIIENNIIIENEDELDRVFKYFNKSILFKDGVLSNEHISDTKLDLFGEINNKTTKLSLDDNDKSQKDMKFKNNLKISKFINFVYNKDINIQRKLLEKIENYLSNGNEECQIDIIPTLIYKYMKLLTDMKSISNEEENIDVKEMNKIFNKISKLIEIIKEAEPIEAIRLNLDNAILSNSINLNNITYEYFIETFIIYEELIIENKIQYESLIIIINTLMSMDNMIINDIEEFDKLILKATLYGSRLMKKSDQCRAIYKSSHLWWINKDSEEGEGDDDEGEEDTTPITLKRDDKRVLECLQKSLRIADSISDRNIAIELFIEILNESVYYFIHGIESVSIRYLNGLIELISNSFKENGRSEIQYGYYERTLKYIKAQRPIDSRFFDIVTV
ncbi:retromer subunit [Pichia kluyveri]|uniref:Vacuolar protein sorting-associated protein 35 n=1 Tax=Pichia kluyveri TaxID=36015 RepID=A0AAV5R5Y3_PICKL|nr:retromer subunit [Pichia kluyveri]